MRRGESIHIRKVCAEKHQAAGINEFALIIYRGEAIHGRQLHYPFSMSPERDVSY